MAYNTSAANWWRFKDDYALSHHLEDFCGNLDYQYLIDITGDDKADSMRELDSPYDDLDYTFYTDEYYKNTVSIGDIDLSKC